VREQEFKDAALVVLGHGTTLNDGSALAVQQHAADLARRNLFAIVRPAFWKQEPHLHAVLRELPHARVFVIPFMISEGYFANEVIPRELGLTLTTALESRARATAAGKLFYGRPVGTHPRMTEVLLARARDVVARHPFPRAPRPGETTLFIAGHGTERNAQSRDAIEAQVQRLRAQEQYAEVRGVYLDEEPRIAGCLETARTRHVVMVPFFISDGLHTTEDIPVLLGEPERLVKERLAAGQPTWRNPTERQGKLIWFSPAIGSEPLLAELILERVRELAESA
jgi:sirohydrochlorin cobaltochelatase